MVIPLFGYIDLVALLAALGGLILILSFFNRNRGGVVSNLVLDQYDITENEPINKVNIRGRRAGWLATLLGFLGFGNQYHIVVTNRFVTIQQDNRSAESAVNIPITAVSGVAYGFWRPRVSLWIGTAFCAFGIVASSTNFFLSLFILLIGASIIYFDYWRGQLIEVRVTCGDSYWYGYNYKIGNVGTIEKARRTAQIIQQLIHYSSAQSTAL
jgi:hypothetical protein